MIVKSQQIVSTGYNGSPRGTVNCSDGASACVTNSGPRSPASITSGAARCMARPMRLSTRLAFDMIGATLYLVGLDANGRGRHGCRALPDVQTHDHQRRHRTGSGPVRREGIITTYNVADWADNNLGEYKLVDGKMVAVRPEKVLKRHEAITDQPAHRDAKKFMSDHRFACPTLHTGPPGLAVPRGPSAAKSPRATRLGHHRFRQGRFLKARPPALHRSQRHTGQGRKAGQDHMPKRS